MENDLKEIMLPAHALRKRITIVSLLLILTGITIAFSISNSISKALAKLNEGTALIGRGELDYRITIDSHDEFGELGNSFNDMAQNLQKVIASRDELNAEKIVLKKTKEALQVSEKELVAKNKELEQIVYVTSHDLRSPLVNIQGFSTEIENDIEKLVRVFQNKKIPEEIREEIVPLLLEDIPESLEFIKKSSIKMDVLLSGLLRLSRLGSVLTKIEKCDMNSLLVEVIATIEFQIKSAGAIAEISPLPPCRGDVNLLNQVFSNLIDNAVKYLDPDRPGQIQITGHVVEGKAIYSIADNGIGIAAEHRDNIFEIFHQLNPDVNPGEGLGLNIISRILDKQNGKVWLESEPGRGSTFYVELPG